MKAGWTGCGTALVTPFTETGALDEAAITRLARRQIEDGVHFLVPCGTTGESPTLAPTEKLRVVELVLAEAAGKVPVLAGAGGYDTHATVKLAQDMTRLGADGVLSVTPYYNKPSQEGLYQHFWTIAESVDAPVVLYNVPSRTGCNIEPATLLRLAAVPNIVGLKEASGNLGQMSIICREVPDDFSVLSGDDAFTLALMAMGGKGVISVVANEAPADMAQLVTAGLKSDFTTARSIHHRLLPLMQVNFVGVEPDSSESCSGGNGTHSGAVSAAAGSTSVCLATTNRRGADGARPDRRRAAHGGIRLSRARGADRDDGANT